jgi:hypothetical protein
LSILKICPPSSPLSLSYLYIYERPHLPRAIEFDFGNNWAEAMGQTSYYALQTGKKPGIVLILETLKNRKYRIRLNTTIENFNLPIDTWNIGIASY